MLSLNINISKHKYISGPVTSIWAVIGVEQQRLGVARAMHSYSVSKRQAPRFSLWRRNLDFTVARKQANSRSTTKCAGPTRYFSMPPLLSHSLFLFPPSLTSPMRAASGLWISPGERSRGPAGWWRSGHLATGTSIHLSLPLSPAMEALTGAPPPRLVRAVVFSGDGGLPGLPGPLTSPERCPLISAVAELPMPRRIPRRAAGRPHR